MKPKNKYFKLHLYIIFLFLVLTIFLTSNKHSRTGYFNYNSEIWADKAGYFVYLPAAFNFNFNPKLFPDSIDIKTGNGFVLDYENNVVKTKYFYGVSLMAAPFYLIANVLSTPLGFEKNGFSPIYHKMMNMAAVFYLLAGLILLGIFLKNYFRTKIIYVTLFLLFFGTNLFYYAIDETLMSHIYSFFLFSAFLYIVKKNNFFTNPKLLSSFMFGVIIGLMLATRPTNFIFLLVFFFLDINYFKDILIRIKGFFNLKFLLPFSLGAVLLIIPQLVYWWYLSGSLVKYTYAGESFNFLAPKFIESWFSPMNGLFLYSPMYLFVVITAIYGIFKKHLNSCLVISMFLIVSYISASWWNWTFGCSFGGRNYVEYTAIFSISLAYFLEKITSFKLVYRIFFILLLAIFVIYNLKLTFIFDECFFGQCCWDWQTFTKYFK